MDTPLLEGLRVVELGTGFAAAYAGMVLADHGAEVVMIEPPSGAAVRHSPGFPFLGRGKHSVVLDLGRSVDRARLVSAVGAADVLIETFGDERMRRLGLGYGEVATANPGLVYGSITGFGDEGPLAGVPGYEALVMARIGALDAFGDITSRPGPAHAEVPYCSYSAAHTLLHGVLSTLLSRSATGRGRRVTTSLLAGLAAHDVSGWHQHIVTSRFPDAFHAVPHVEDGIPNSALVFRLLVALSSDDDWLQFSQTSSHLYRALMRELGLDWMFDDPEWQEIPHHPDPQHRLELWGRMLHEVRSRSTAEWQAVFDREPNVWAERFRHGDDVLDHPQLVHDQSVIEVRSTACGVTRQPGPIAHIDVAPAVVRAGAPLLGEGAAMPERWAPRAGVPTDAAAARPLEGVTVLELGLYYAAPFAATLLADLGARVIKVEPLAGDPLRHLSAFPEVGAIKAMQGKESILVDLATEEGRRVVHQLAARSDIVLQSFRAGVAERLAVDVRSLRAVNPALVYVNAQGYGASGPCGHRPAYAPTIAAASGIAWRMAGRSMPDDPASLDIAAEQAAAVGLIAATNTGFAQCDGVSAVANATACLLGLLARSQGRGAATVRTSMLLAATHANCEVVLQPADGRPVPAPQGDAPPIADQPDDTQLLGPTPLYRLYECADGWVFLAAPNLARWPTLCSALRPWVDLADDPRFVGESERARHGEDLAEVLGQVFLRRDALEWETDLLAAGVGCIAVRKGPVPARMVDEIAPMCGLIAEVEHPMLGAHPRLAALVRCSDVELPVLPGCMPGEHTDRLLEWLGYSDDEVTALRASGGVA